jgi:signal transduction histidine kinase
MSSAGRSATASLSLRILGWYTFVFVAALLFATASLWLGVRASLRGEVHRQIALELEESRQIILSSGVASLDSHFAAVDVSAAPYVVRVSDERGQTIYEYRSRSSTKAPLPALRSDGYEPRWSRAQRDGEPWHQAVMRLTRNQWLEVDVSEVDVARLLGHVRNGLVVAWLIALVAGALGCFYLVRRALAPVRQLRDTTLRVIASGDLDARVPRGRRSGELDELARLFNEMLERQARLVTGMRRALDDVGHDLRTPLTRIRTGAEVALKDEAASAPVLREALADAIEECERTLAMLGVLLDVSEAESGVMQLRREPVDLAQIAREAVDLYEHVGADRGVRLVTHLGEAAVIEADRERLRRVVSNLVDNALKYTNPGGQVEVSVGLDDVDATLTVHDTGVGIDERERPQIFQRLYRGDRSRSTRGLGLGLSFVKAIVDAHGGRVEVQSALGSGSTFTVTLPRRRRPLSDDERAPVSNVPGPQPHHPPHP